MQNTGNSSRWGIVHVYVDELGFVFVGATTRRLVIPPSGREVARAKRVTEGERKYLLVSLPQSNAVHLTAPSSEGAETAGDS